MLLLADSAHQQLMDRFEHLQNVRYVGYRIQLVGRRASPLFPCKRYRSFLEFSAFLTCFRFGSDRNDPNKQEGEFSAKSRLVFNIKP